MWKNKVLNESIRTEKKEANWKNQTETNSNLVDINSSELNTLQWKD